MKDEQTKLIFFDLDGTLTDGCEFVFGHVWDYFNLDHELSKKLIADFNAGRLSYEDWVKEDIRIFKEAGVTRDEMIRSFGKIYVTKGAHEVLGVLKGENYKIFVVSGGIDLVIYHLFPHWQEIFEDIFINKYIFDPQGSIADAIPTPYDFEHKATCIRDMAKKYGVNIDQTVFVGDNHNDIHAAIAAGTSVAFNCKSDQLVQVATHHVESNDLRDILPYC
ncbi:HAD-IB family phosphatase [Candidatus Saccharibacteria bacterium]|nr:HAD-IB family phosphatase [Candidatus Saccharibacteria bacterium]